MNFKTFMISSQTKHESFDSFGSQVQLLYFLNIGIPIFFFECNEPTLSFFMFVFKDFVFKDIET